MTTAMIKKMATEVPKVVDATVGYQDPQSGQKFMLMINQALCMNGLENHLLCPI